MYLCCFPEDTLTLTYGWILRLFTRAGFFCSNIFKTGVNIKPVAGHVTMNRMNRSMVCMVAALLFIIQPLMFITQDVHSETTVNATALSGGWLEERDGVKILHLSGSNYEMGYQHGYLLKNEIEENMRIMFGFLFQKGYSYSDLLEIWNVMEGFLPQEYKDEMQGMADGSGMSYETIAVYSTWPAVFNHLYCFGGSLWGSATADGTLYHVRSLDWAGGFDFYDQETDTYFRENQVLIVRNPDNGYASVSPEFAGAICCWGGINEKGIGISETTCLSYDTTFQGISAAFRMRMVLDRATTGEEAIAIMRENRTCGWNFIVSDGNIPRGYVMEQTANLVYVGTWFDSVERTPPFWAIEDVVRRGPCFINPMCAATQKERPNYDPSGLRGFLLFMLGKNPYFSVWSMYRAMSHEIERQYGSLDLNGTMALLRDVYLGKTDMVFLLMQLMGSYRSFHQWVACPETGDILVSFADENRPANRNPVHHFTLQELVDAEPPP